MPPGFDPYPLMLLTVPMITSAGIVAGILAARVGPGQSFAEYPGYRCIW